MLVCPLVVGFESLFYLGGFELDVLVLVRWLYGVVFVDSAASHSLARVDRSSLLAEVRDCVEPLL